MTKRFRKFYVLTKKTPTFQKPWCIVNFLTVLCDGAIPIYVSKVSSDFRKSWRRLGKVAQRIFFKGKRIRKLDGILMKVASFEMFYLL